jgi:hypothetical protein
MYYAAFDEYGYQEQTQLANKKPEGDWYAIGEDVDGKRFRLVASSPVLMTEKDKEDYLNSLSISSNLDMARNKRNLALRDSDWTQLSSSPLSDEKKAEWEIYRQALRDYLEVLKNNPEAAFPAEPQ